MSLDKDRILIRGKDIGLIIGIITLAGMVLAYAKKPAEWDQTVEDIKTLKPVIWNNKSRVDILETKVDYMVKTLERIDRKLDK